ncbi:BON domain-containing protein [Phenylobacterium sp. J367]|uniref:BON domain-containing protein n=1 Tax=Phenylobacterium sp. J367 TaxID=2898435 RepID=UPI002150DA77|nr:BON domain-containing protein [Phenylobacterium sp. J367]MCR5880528.1 BON domain-containing protein [Phenylobacterium sp. J367]
MAREDWRQRDDGRWERQERPAGRDDFGQADYSTDYGYDPQRRAGYRADAEPDVRRDDYGQADYSKDYAYDRDRGAAYRRFSADDPDYVRRMDDGDYRRDEGRSWRERTGGLFGGRPAEDRSPRRRGSSDRVLWAVIVERLEDERRLDLRDVEVIVEDREVTLNGTVRRKEDRRRIEDIADIDGVRHVQNNLRVRDRGGWTFL